MAAKIESIKAHRRKRNQDDIAKAIAEVLDGHGPDAVGVALVLWDADGHSTACCRALLGSRIPPVLVPEFVKMRLLGEVIEGWAVDAVEDNG